MTNPRTSSKYLPTFQRCACFLSSAPLWRALLVRVFVPALAVAALGYLAAYASTRACLRSSRLSVEGSFARSEVAAPLRWVPANRLTDRYVTEPYDPNDLVPPWRTRTLFFGLRLYFPSTRTPLPWAYVRSAPPRYPFIVCIDHGLFARNLYGEAGTHVYVAFFGLHHRLAAWSTWFS